MPAYLGRPAPPARPSRACRTALLGLTAVAVMSGPPGSTDAANATSTTNATSTASTTAPRAVGVTSPAHAGNSTNALDAAGAVHAIPGAAPAVAPAVARAESHGNPSPGNEPPGNDVENPSARAASARAASATGRKQSQSPAERTVTRRSPVVRRAAAEPKATGARAHRAASRKALRQTLGPRATLARTPAARSSTTTRLLARAFPHFERFTWQGPVSQTRQTSGFGRRWGRPHAGLDFAGPVGTRLKSLSSGVVTFAGRQGGYGNKVEIMHWDGSLVAYGHMDSIAVAKGQRLAPGHVIGRLGNSGRSTGPHLHLEVHPGGGEAIDPWPWLVQRGILPRDVPTT